MNSIPTLSGRLGATWPFRFAVYPALAASFVLQGCSTVGTPLPPPVSLSPSTARLAVGARVRLKAAGAVPLQSCTWGSSDPAVLTSLGGGEFVGASDGAATASANCGDSPPALAQLEVSSVPAGPLVITQGGTYTGEWTSNDPNTPAVTIKTSEQVILRDSVITGRGDLIAIENVPGGAHVNIHDVTGLALDPGLRGLQRGSFIAATQLGSLRVHHCSLIGVSFGVKLVSSTPAELVISENLGSNLEDRASDGEGGLLPLRPQLGHFVFLNQVISPAGADISWNQFENTIGQSSVEDVISLYKSQGSPTLPLHVHDNFLEGFSSTTTASYTGAGIIADGDAHEPVTAYALIDDNQVVHAAGSGIEIAAGHDVTVTHNRVVSCGRGVSGTWYAMPFVNAVVVWNYYAAPEFYNNSVVDTAGGVLRPSSDNTPEIADLWYRSSDLGPTDSLGPNTFSDPCWMDGNLNLAAEDAEREAWISKLGQAGITVGDRHMP